MDNREAFLGESNDGKKEKYLLLLTVSQGAKILVMAKVSTAVGGRVVIWTKQFNSFVKRLSTRAKL